jgi:hypothetical protein
VQYRELGGRVRRVDDLGLGHAVAFVGREKGVRIPDTFSGSKKGS